MAEQKSFRIKISREITLTGQDIDDIVTGALEGGITYWCDRAEVVGGEYLGEYASEQISRGGALRLHDAEERKTHILTLSKLLKGVKRWFEEGGDKYNAVKPDGSVDTGNIDGEIADAIIQYAVIGDWVYG